MKKGPVSDFLGWHLGTRHPQNSRKQHYDKHIIKNRLSKIAIWNILQQITDVKYERWFGKVNLTFYRDEPHHIKIFNLHGAARYYTRCCKGNQPSLWKMGNWRCQKSKTLNKIQHTHTHLMALCPGLPRWAGTRKVKPIWILLKQEIVSVSGISWNIHKSAPCSRQITTPAPHHSVFYRPDALPAAQPTVSKHWRHINVKY